MVTHPPCTKGLAIMQDLCSATMRNCLQTHINTDRGHHSAARAADLTSCVEWSRSCRMVTHTHADRWPRRFAAELAMPASGWRPAISSLLIPKIE